MPSLFDPIQLGAISAPNRILMAPLTRGRASVDHVPTPVMARYYALRAEAGLIISEGTGISRQGMGWSHAPGIWSVEQREAWKPITDAVHEAGGRIICQLWHMGRLVHPHFLGGEPPVSSSATTAPDYAYLDDRSKAPYAEARSLAIEEIPGIIADYRRAAENAMLAGFDGVQIHAANGYLIDQFLRDSGNFRTDAYGGSIENRIRLLDEVTRGVAATVGKDRVAVRLSPTGEIQGVDDSNPVPLFQAAARCLSDIGIAFLELRDPRPGGSFFPAEVQQVGPFLRDCFKGTLVLNSDYDLASANAALAAGEADAVSFGRPFIVNPDLVRRFREGLPVATEQRIDRWYFPGEDGYLDFPLAA